MSFRREYSKINRGLRCRRSTGQSWALGVFFFYRCARGGGRSWSDCAFWGLGDLFNRDLTGGYARRRRRGEELPLRAYGGIQSSFFPDNLKRNPPPYFPPPKKNFPKTHTHPSKLIRPLLPLFLQMVPPPRHQKNDRRTLPGFGPVHLACRTHRFLRLV